MGKSWTLGIVILPIKSLLHFYKGAIQRDTFFGDLDPLPHFLILRMNKKIEE